MNTYGLPIYKKNSKDDDTYEEDEKNGKTQYSEKLMKNFSVYSEYIDDNIGDKYALYQAGLELFEVVKEHTQIIKLRDYIEHFHYYYDVINNGENSLLDLYGEVFDRYFTYDNKYRKNVPNILYNILINHFVIVVFDYTTGKKLIDKNIKKNRAAFRIKEIKSEKYTYKLKNEEEPISLYAKGENYVENVAMLLFYPHTNDMPDFSNENSNNQKKNNMDGKDTKHTNKKNNSKTVLTHSLGDIIAGLGITKS